jgi:TolB protein
MSHKAISSLAMLAFLLAALALAPAASGIGGGRIAFQSNRDGKPGIFAIDPNGANEARLTAKTVDSRRPAFSNDGRQIAFDSNRGKGNEIYLMKRTGGDELQITNGPSASYDASFSRDGRQIVFVNNQSGKGDIFVMDSHGGNKRQLTNNGVNDSQPVFSPDGKQIAFTHFQNGTSVIDVIDVDGSNEHTLTKQGSSGNEHPSYSPNGNEIVYETATSGNTTGIATMRASDGRERNIILDNAVEPSFSPDGSTIVFRQGQQLFTMNALGPPAPTQLTFTASGANINPSWAR